MDINLQRIFIPTINKARLISFLTAVFDAEVCLEVNNEEYINFDGIKLFFLEMDKVPKSKFATFSFTVDEPELLEDIKNKINQNTLIFKDPDQNTWNVEYIGDIAQISQIVAAQQPHMTTSVRI